MEGGLPTLWPGTSLRGRATACARLDELVAAVRGGESRSLVLRGEAGIGKTALLEYLVESASDLTIARAVGMESEMELAFASLHQLSWPLLDRLDRLPAPQREALEIVFGMSAGSPPDRFLVGLAVLSLLSEVAEEQPLLCVVDDAQWLDHASELTLGFVARRLLAEPIGLVFAARAPSDALLHVSELEVEGLGTGDAQALLGSAVQFMLDEQVRDRIVAETRGNPLALLELPRELTAAQLAGGFGLPELLPLSGQIEESYLRRLEELPQETRLLLLVAAAEPVGDPALVWRAATQLGVARTALAPAARAGLLQIGAQVRFRHPLVRSAVYRFAAEDDRRSAHEALADVTDPALEPDRRAWHRAQATPAPDDDVAAELERSADRAQARGGLAAAGAFLARAADLTIDPSRRTERTLVAATLNLQAGAFDAALGLLAVAQAGPLDELGQARVDLLHGQIAYAHDRGSDGPLMLLKAARKLEPLDVRLARDTYLDAWSAALFAGQLANAASLLHVSEAVLAAPKPADPPHASDLLLDGFALVFTEGRPAADPVLKRATTAFAGPEISAQELLRWGWLATVAGVYVWDYDTCLAVAIRGVQLARDIGALEVLAVADNILAQAAAMGGDFATAAELVAEADAVTEATGTRTGPYGALVLSAFRGRESEVSKLVAATVQDAAADGQGTIIQFTHYARAVVMNGLGRYDEAMAAAIEASDDTPELVVSRWALSELIEAASRTSKIELAKRALARLGEHTQDSDSDWALGIEARARALVSEGEAADRLYRESIDHLARTRLRPELARSRLLYGEWLRRANRRVDAREQLLAAHEAFVTMGADAFAERARRELAATGEKVRKRSIETRDELTPQEAHIARLARDGLSNPEIGARLFLSPRTVEWHLRKVFTKLGIHSRRELVRALPSPDGELAA